jgi:hypothetical protein
MAHSTVTTEKTSKQLKLSLVLSHLVIVASPILLLVSLASGRDAGEAIAVSVIIVVIGLIWLIATRIGIWWHHG